MFLATIADGKQLLHGEKGRKTAKTHTEPAFWMGPPLRTHTPQIGGVKISPPKFRERAPENTVKQVFFEDSPPKFGG